MPTLSRSERLLVVSDDPLQRKLVRCLLLDAGYAVAAALPLVDRERIDLLLLDGRLPGLERLARRLRAGHDDVAILSLTDRRDLEATIAAFDAGVDDCLACPFAPRELLARAGALLGRSVWGREEGASNRLEVHIGRLRRKLAALEAPARIGTVRSA